MHPPAPTAVTAEKEQAAMPRTHRGGTMVERQRAGIESRMMPVVLLMEMLQPARTCGLKPPRRPETVTAGVLPQQMHQLTSCGLMHPRSHRQQSAVRSGTAAPQPLQRAIELGPPSALAPLMLEVMGRKLPLGSQQPSAQQQPQRTRQPGSGLSPRPRRRRLRRRSHLPKGATAPRQRGRTGCSRHRTTQMPSAGALPVPCLLATRNLQHSLMLRGKQHREVRPLLTQAETANPLQRQKN
mmetsp:Transcript_18747/g.56697  ORF Transcript_18747/g.56697 Transcript_18747/m.56697 type:complete len:240 (-) Transcript_18747:1051-1770(-)